MYRVPNLMSVKQMVLKILSSQRISISSLTLDLKIKRGHFLFNRKFDVLQAKGVISISLSPVWPLTFDLKIRVIDSLGCTKFDVCQANDVQFIEWIVYFMSSVTWLLTSKSIGILYLSPTHVWNIITYNPKKKVFMILSGQHMVYQTTGAKQEGHKNNSWITELAN
jgi:hypothetical protein